MNKTQLLIRDLVLLLFAILVTSLLGCQDDAPDSALMAPSTESTGATNVGRTSITVAGRYLGNLDKITEYGVKYSTSNNFPSDATTYVRFTGSPTSIVSAVLEGLSANTHYYYSWYATTGATEVSSSYGEFTTTATSKPQFSELSVDSVAENYALIRCRVLDVGDDYLVEGGIAYRIKTSSSSERYTQVAADEVDANNEFTVVLNELSAGTTYEVRAYAKNGSDAEGENGMMESYGETITFSTDNQLAPELEAYDPTDVGMSSARVIAKVTAAKGSNGVYTERGFCYSTTSQDPTIYDNFHKVDGTDFEAFAVVFTGLQQQTTYYVRAYAKNIVDGAERVGYSSRMEFTTSALATPLVYFSDDYESTSTASTIKAQAYIDNYDANALTEKGFFWSTDDSNVTLETAKKNNQYLVVTTGDKVFSGTITGLASNTTYRIKAYATVEASGETLTGSTEARYFYTNQNNSATLKDIETTGSTISSITMKTGISSLNEGTLVEKGFCWKVWNDNWDLSLDNCEGSLKSDGDDDSYTATITGLVSNTTYLIEGYVKTEIEGETLVGYSSSVTVSTNSVFSGGAGWSNTSTSITLSPRINGVEDSDILEKGIICKIDEGNSNPTLEDNDGAVKVDTKLDSNGSYSGTIENLRIGTNYVLRGYIKINSGDQTITIYSSTWQLYTEGLVSGGGSCDRTSSSLAPSFWISTSIVDQFSSWEIYLYKDGTNWEETTPKAATVSSSDDNWTIYTATFEDLEAETSYDTFIRAKDKDGNYVSSGTWSWSTKAVGREPSVDDNVSPGKKD